MIPGSRVVEIKFGDFGIGYLPRASFRITRFENCRPSGAIFVFFSQLFVFFLYDNFLRAIIFRNHISIVGYIFTLSFFVMNIRFFAG